MPVVPALSQLRYEDCDFSFTRGCRVKMLSCPHPRENKTTSPNILNVEAELPDCLCRQYPYLKMLLNVTVKNNKPQEKEERNYRTVGKCNKWHIDCSFIMYFI